MWRPSTAPSSSLVRRSAHRCPFCFVRRGCRLMTVFASGTGHRHCKSVSAEHTNCHTKLVHNLPSSTSPVRTRSHHCHSQLPLSRPPPSTAWSWFPHHRDRSRCHAVGRHTSCHEALVGQHAMPVWPWAARLVQAGLAYPVLLGRRQDSTHWPEILFQFSD
jgi:hypothetical protein